MKSPYNQGVTPKPPYTEEGGYLAFTPTYFGEVLVWMQLPEIKALMRNDEGIIVFDEIPPEEITTEKIIEMADKFLKKILDWKRGKFYDRKPIGFKLPV